MGINFADLDRQVLTLVAQHLILLSTAELSDKKPRSGRSSVDLFHKNVVSSSLSKQNALRSRTRIDSLLNLGPGDIQDLVAAELPSLTQRLSEPCQCRPRPVYILPLLLTCRKIHNVLSVEGNPTLYKWLYEKTFDTVAVKRRWNTNMIPSWHFQNDNHSYVDYDSTYREAKRRKSGNGGSLPMFPVSWKDHREFDLERNHSLLAEEYRDRLRIFRKFRLLNDESHQEDLREKVAADTQQDSEAEHVFWTIWWMVTEHDEKNIPLLHSMMDLEMSGTALFKKLYLADVTDPGLPPSTVIKALGAWLAVRLDMVTMYEDTPEHVDEKVFALTPFALASFKYPLYIAPWTFRVLPLTKVAQDEEELRLLSRPNAFMPDLTPNELGVPVRRFGREWKVVPNFYADAAGLIFDGILDRHPHLVTLGKRIGTPSYHAAFPHLNLPIPKPQMANHLRSPSFSGKQTPSPRGFLLPGFGSQSTHNLTSLQYDQDFVRAMSCASPVTSPGLPPLFYRRKLHGTWKGSFLFFDFEAYRRVLGGNLRSLYEGPFGHQECEWNITESVINVRYDKVGGSGSFLSAGFRIDQTAEEATAEAKLSPDERGWEACEDEDAPDRPGWTKEILLTGQARHSWGTSEIYGRVRMWDGLVMMRQDFSHRAVGRWLYTGYIHAGGLLVGRWRDTFTPESQRGYENAFHLHKISDSADLPIRWSESDYHRYDLPLSASGSGPPSGVLSATDAGPHDNLSNSLSPGERASSQTSSRSFVSENSLQNGMDLSILPPIRNPSIGTEARKAANLKEESPQLPSWRNPPS